MEKPMPLITVQMFPGRTRAQLEQLVERITDAYLDTCGRPGQGRSSVWVVVQEVPAERWAVGGELGPEPDAST
jgi:4-oxalocrotonate tautomerase